MRLKANRQTNLTRYRTIGHHLGMLGQEIRDIEEMFDTTILEKDSLAELEERITSLRDEEIRPLLEAIKKARALKVNSAQS